jgi:MoaA/NifB/PqqE/SkfB family radical SAM enzyme
MRAVISTNGTLITAGIWLERSRSIGLSYVGISLDGMEGSTISSGGERRLRQGLEGIRNCQEAGIKVGLRFTINKFNVK